MTASCGHDAPAYGPPMCEHIRAAAGPIDYVTRYTGVGTATDRVCHGCRDAVAGGRAVETARACEECFAAGMRTLTGAVGSPEVRERPTAVDPTLRATAVPAEWGAVADLAAVDGGTAGWLVLCEDGRIVRWEPDSGDWAVLARTEVRVPPDAEPWSDHWPARRLHASSDGRFAAVVVDHGRYGEVLDLSTGTRTMTLDGGDYCAETVPFSLAFAQHRDRTVLVHRTEWNRLDVSDPGTGEPLTSRAFAPVDSDRLRPPHDLDYFHGGLLVSPDGRRVVDDGWVWSPVGVVTAWSLAGWLDENPFESEDGATKSHLASCDYHWNRPLAWLDDHRVAVGGLGEHDYEIVPGARVFDVRRTDGAWAAETAAFGGPEGRFFSADGLLFSASPQGLEVWDPADGARLAVLPGFRPTHHHRTGREFARIDGGDGGGARLLRWRIDPGLVVRR
ncbi:hypothetical protein ACFY00_04135 [Kitasatospora sp. NPDC001540]|uniref:hypothetical protein n=1 Tax=Kitasatospora sp. NPDC001540 TaxID=3364014 RepID=UPI0036C1A91E